MRRILIAVVMLVVLAVMGVPAFARAGVDVAAQWSGDIKVGAQTLRVILVVKGPDAATISIPDQGLKDGKLQKVAIDATSMSFRLHVPPMPEAAAAVFNLAVDNEAGTAEGTMTQMGSMMPIKLVRAKAGEDLRPKRPQTPVKPYPYKSEDVTFDNSVSKGKLAGTLTIPDDKWLRPTKDGKSQRHAAVVLISGSGAQDRDSTVFGHQPFAVLADELTREGIAVLRVDDPGVGGSTNPYGNAGTTELFVKDVLAAVEYLKTRGEIDPLRIGLIGHSEGGVIAQMAAAENPEIAFIVMLAGTGVNGREVLQSQLAAMNKAAGMTDEDNRKSLELQAAALNLVAKDLPTHQLLPRLAELARDKLAAPESMTEQQQAALLGPSLASPWVRAFVKLDPREALRKVKCPVLVLNGSLDLQVLASVNVGPIAAALMQAGNPDVTIRVMPGLNHFFQPATTGSINEYATIPTTIDNSALDEIGDWVKRKVGLGR